jgi:hypothetical protein
VALTPVPERGRVRGHRYGAPPVVALASTRGEGLGLRGRGVAVLRGDPHRNGHDASGGCRGARAPHGNELETGDYDLQGAPHRLRDTALATRRAMTTRRPETRSSLAHTP